MLVEELSNVIVPKTLSRAQQKAGYAVLDPAARLRQTARHIEELQKDNYNDVKIEISGVHAAERKKQTLGVRKILASKKSLQNHMDECGTDDYLNAALPNWSYPARKFCSVCGYWGKYKCAKCGLANCSQVCEATHKETRCQR